MQAVLINPDRRPSYLVSEMEDLALRGVSSEVDEEDEALTDNDLKDERSCDGGGDRKEREEMGLEKDGRR